MRKLHQFGGTAAAMLDAEDDAVSRPEVPALRIVADAPRPRRELVDDYADDEDTEAYLRASGRARRIRRGLIPKTRNGWIAAGVATAVALGAIAAGGFATLRFMTTNEKFRMTSSQNIELDGNSHLSRAQMLSVFGEDVDGNIFRVPMEQRREQLEQMPWVEHATVMRLLPNRMRVHVIERVPVAFVRQGSNIGLVDKSGVLLDIPPDAPGNPSYSFPVLTGLKAEQEPEARAQRMRLYAAFLRDLDSDGKSTSAQLSEIDLSDPEDVKALIPDHNSEVLVHFGTEHFLTRYKQFEEHIAEWRSQYARLSSVDMRYERQVVLQMPPKDSTVGGSGGAGDSAAPKGDAATGAAASKLAASAPSKAIASAKPVAPAKAVAPARPVVSVKPAPMPVKTAGPTTTASVPPKAAPVAKPAVHAVAKPVHAARPATKSSAKDAATHKRVEAIKAWMAKRHAAQNHSSGGN
ncbi:cell division protein FtsQ/DivIB [Terriglobus roseus]|nr:FtsQ-type POTRA domain-containing protein [Terriglobus roseus]